MKKNKEQNIFSRVKIQHVLMVTVFLVGFILGTYSFALTTQGSLFTLGAFGDGESAENQQANGFFTWGAPWDSFFGGWNSAADDSNEEEDDQVNDNEELWTNDEPVYYNSDNTLSNNLGTSSTPSRNTIPAANSCNKAGLNWASQFPPDINALERAKALNMSYYLQLVNNPNDQLQNSQAMAGTFAAALDRGITPILRVCDRSTQDCPFKEPESYLSYIDAIATDPRINGRTFYALAGPNEPLAENWLGGAEGVPEEIAPPVARYTNAIIRGNRNQNVKLMSPVFNLSHPEFSNFFTALVNNGLNFRSLDVIGGNAYNLHGTIRIEDQVKKNDVNGSPSLKDKMAQHGLIHKQIFLTEIGKFEENHGVPKDVAFANLYEEVQKLRYHSPKIIGYLYFNGFGNNTTSEPGDNFAYGALTNEEFNRLHEGCS